MRAAFPPPLAEVSDGRATPTAEGRERGQVSLGGAQVGCGPGNLASRTSLTCRVRARITFCCTLIRTGTESSRFGITEAERRNP